MINRRFVFILWFGFLAVLGALAPLRGQTPVGIEPLGQSSRKTSLVISEIMYHPPLRTDARELEFVEIYNSLSTPEDLSGWRLDGDADFLFPTNTVILGRGFLVIARAPTDVQAVYGIANVIGPFSSTNSLPNDRGVVQLKNRRGAVFLEARYDSDPPWPPSADRAGHSLILGRPSYGEGNVRAWAASDAVGGSPGRADPVTTEPRRNVMINEFLAHTDDPAVDYIELYNHSTVAVDVTGCILTDSPDTNKFVITGSLIIPSRGFAVFYQSNIGFSLASGGETIFFKDPTGSRVLDAVRFDAQANGISSGRHPDGSPMFSVLSTNTPGRTNAPIAIPPVVINEIMYHPISNDGDHEFIELFNRTGTNVNLAGWRLRGGIDFNFPSTARLAPNGYLVVAKNRSWLMTNNPAINPTNIYGNFGGNLNDRSERIVLTMPDPFLVTNSGVVITNFIHIPVDEVTYSDGGRWGAWSDGGGSSLELIDPRSDNRLAANWADSLDTSEAPWTSVSVRGVLDNGTSPADQLQVLLMGKGECLIDDVQVLNSSGVNQLAATNSNFEVGSGGWVAEGTEKRSNLENSEGYLSARSYHVRASDRGDNQINRIRTPLIAAQTPGTTCTINAKVRWLRGHPELLFRLRGNWHEAPVLMNLPGTLGTPGAPNSRALANSAPAISDVTHRPIAPAANQNVVVTARVHDPDGLQTFQLRYRVDPTGAVVPVNMVDNGTAGDAVAGDGLFSGLIPGQPSGLVAFYLVATDRVTPGATSSFPSDAPVHECLVRFADPVPAGTFPSYKLWLTQASFNTWDVNHNLDNTGNDFTFVLGNHRVIYNAQAAYAGSPYIGPSFDTPSGRRCGYSISFPSDDRFLGDAALVLDWPGGHGNENTAIQEQMSYWMADQMDLPFSHRYFIRFAVNGVTDMARGGVFEAALQPGGDFLEQWSPGDTDGDFFKIDRAFEFSDGGGLIADPQPQLRVFTTPDLTNGGFRKKTETYRWTWLKRSFERAHNYTNLFVLADVLNSPSPEPYTSQTEALVDLEEWMGIFAVEHIILNFDSWGHTIGKNMYMYKPEQGPWEIYMFDNDWLMLVSVNGPGNYTASTGPLFVSNDPTVTRMYNHPPFRRAYFRAVQHAVDNAFVASKYQAVMDAKYNSLVANGITLCDGMALAAPTAVKNWFAERRNYLVAQLAAVAANFAITTSNGNNFTVNSNVATLTGTAPVGVKTIQVNGSPYDVTWTTVSNWTLRVPLVTGSNSIVLAGLDGNGAVFSNLTDTISISSTAPNPTPVGSVVINEIMYNSPNPDAEFIEIYNNSLTTSHNLSGWRLNGVDYIFPFGTILDPGTYLVVARDVAAFAATYGAQIPVLGQYAGTLDNGGETISLIMPGATASQDVIIDSVSYDDDLPWPAEADGLGSSLQLVDPNQDNSRVANWDVVTNSQSPSSIATPGSPNSVRSTLPAFPQVWINELQPENITGVMDNAGEREPWVELYNPGSTAISLNGWFMTDSYSNLTRWAFPASASIGPGQYLLVWLDGEIGESVSNSLHANFRPAPVSGSLALVYPFNGQPTVLDYVNYQQVSADRSYGSYPNAQTGARQQFFFSTPGATNNSSVPAVQLFINEWMAANTVTLPDPTDTNYDDWFEIYNPGSVPIDLGGYLLSDSLTNVAARWSIPAGKIVPAQGFLLVWADSNPSANTNHAEIHTNFRLAQGGESIALFSQAGVLIDSVTFGAQTNDISQGRWPDGSGSIYFMPSPTPRLPNRIPGSATEPLVLLSPIKDPSGNIILRWNALPGRTYQVETRTDLLSGNWNFLSEVVASGTNGVSTNAPSGPVRFYRVRLLVP